MLFGHGALFQVSGSLLAGRATVAEPEENDHLANEHTKRAGRQASEDAESSRNNDETEDTRDGAPQSTMVEVVVVVHVRMVREMMSIGRRGALTPGRRFLARCVEGARTESMVVRAVVHRLRAMMLAMASLSTGQTGAHLQHTRLSASKQVAHTGEEQRSQAAGLATALLPGDTVWSRLLDIGLGHVDAALRFVDESDGNSVHGNGVAVQVKNSKSDLQQFDIRLFRRCRQRHHLEGVAQRDGVRILTVGLAMLDGADPAGRRRGEDLTAVGQKESIIDRKVQ